MVFVRTAFFPGGTAAHYAALAEEIGDVAPPGGRLMFAAGEVAEGFRVVQVWRSRQDLDAFNNAVLFPAFARLRDRGFPRPPEVIDFDATVVHPEALP